MDHFDIYTDHEALQHFMTTKKLNARQARWADFLSRFHFLIRYRPGRENILADALTRREQDLDKKNLDHHDQMLLKPEWFEGNQRSIPIELAPVDEALTIVDRVLQANKEDPSLDKYRKRADGEDKD
jgi:hypothetical protein